MTPDFDPTDGTWDGLNGYVQGHIFALVEDLVGRGLPPADVLEAARLAVALKKDAYP